MITVVLLTFLALVALVAAAWHDGVFAASALRPLQSLQTRQSPAGGGAPPVQPRGASRGRVG